MSTIAPQRKTFWSAALTIRKAPRHFCDAGFALGVDDGE
jgi:hypothetical protein